MSASVEESEQTVISMVGITNGKGQSPVLDSLSTTVFGICITSGRSWTVSTLGSESTKVGRIGTFCEDVMAPDRHWGLANSQNEVL